MWRVDIVNGKNVRRGLSQSCTRCSKQISKPQLVFIEFIINNTRIWTLFLATEVMGKELDVCVPSKNLPELDGIRRHSEMFRTTEQKRIRTIQMSFKGIGV